MKEQIEELEKMPEQWRRRATNCTGNAAYHKSQGQIERMAEDEGRADVYVLCAKELGECLPALLARVEALEERERELSEIIDEAVQHCELCAGLPLDSTMRCARCKTFNHALGTPHVDALAANGAGEGEGGKG